MWVWTRSFGLSLTTGGGMPKVLSKEAPGEFSTCWYIYLQEPIQTAQVRVSPELLSLIHLNFHGALSSSNVR